MSQAQIEAKRIEDEKKTIDSERKNQKKKSNFLLILSGILYTIINIFSYFLKKLKVLKNNPLGITTFSSSIRLFIYAILSYIFIKHTKFERHQYFSFIIIGIIIILILIVSISIEDTSNYFAKVILKSIISSKNCIVYTIGLFVHGLIGIITSIILQLFLGNISCENSTNFKDGFTLCDEETGKFKTILYSFSKIEGINIFLVFGTIIFNFMETISIFLLMYNYSLNHYGITYIICSFVKIIMDNDKSYEITMVIVTIIGDIIIFFMTLVYNEIIILRFCNLEKYTKTEIRRRCLSDIKNNNIEFQELVFKEDDSQFI